MMMTPFRLLAALALTGGLIAFGTAVRADDNPNAYDDPSIHYVAPDGWQKVDTPPPQQGGQDDQTVARFAKDISRYDKRAIMMKMSDYQGTLDGAESTHESDLRSTSDGVFVDKKERVTLANGMPAWFLKVSIGQDAGNIVRGFEYVVFDGKRRIILGYYGRAGYFDDKDAKDAMASFAVVVYPEGR
jgi:hypothetical protein